MRDNYIIGVLAGIIAAGASFWQYSNMAQPVIVTLTVAFFTAWGKKIIEDEMRRKK